MNTLTPSIKSLGKFKFALPTNTLNPDIVYEVMSNRTIRDMVDDGLNVIDDVYLIIGLLETDYYQDLTDNIIITGLKTESGDMFFIPSNKFISIPDVTGKRYIQKTIALNLGFLPVDLDVNYLLPEITDLITSMLGVTPSSSVIKTSQTIVYTDKEHDVFNVGRIAAISNNETCVGKLIKLNNILTEMRNKEIMLVKTLTA